MLGMCHGKQRQIHHGQKGIVIKTLDSAYWNVSGSKCKIKLIRNVFWSKTSDSASWFRSEQFAKVVLQII
jgi:hypothetical protein